MSKLRFLIISGCRMFKTENLPSTIMLAVGYLLDAVTIDLDSVTEMQDADGQHRQKQPFQ